MLILIFFCILDIKSIAVTLYLTEKLIQVIVKQKLFQFQLFQLFHMICWNHVKFVFVSF